MKKWLIVGGIASALVVGVTVLGIVAVSFLPSSVYAQQGFGSRSPMMRGGPPFEGRDQFGPMNQFGPMGQFRPFDGPKGFGDTIDHEALLADALGITVEELQAAQDQAHQAAVQQAVDEGLIDQDQADLMLAGYQLRRYINRDALMAQALGISIEELQAARDEGKPMAVIIYEQGLDPTTLRTNLQTALDETIQQAIADGVITQEQLDQIKPDTRGGFGPGGFPGRGGFGGPRGGFGGFGWK
jgi:lambda repressor-like predicted transcriptional regulator